MRRFIIVIITFSLLLIAGCGGENIDSENEKNVGEVSIVDWEHSTLYTDTDIKTAIDTVIAYFETEFKGCTLTQISYPGDDSSGLFDKWAKEYEADEAIVLYSSFDTDSSGGDGSLNPNSTYNDWQWILVKNNGGVWELKTYGYG